MNKIGNAIVMFLVGLSLLAFAPLAMGQDNSAIGRYQAMTHTAPATRTSGAIPRNMAPVRIERVPYRGSLVRRAFFGGLGYAMWDNSLNWWVLGNQMELAALRASAVVANNYDQSVAYNATLNTMGRVPDQAVQQQEQQAVSFAPEVLRVPFGKGEIVATLAYNGELTLRDERGKTPSSQVLKAVEEAFRVTGLGQKTREKGRYMVHPVVADHGLAWLFDQIEQFMPTPAVSNGGPCKPRCGEQKQPEWGPVNLPTPEPPIPAPPVVQPVVPQEQPTVVMAPKPLPPNPAISKYLYACKARVQLERELKADNLEVLDLDARALTLWNAFPTQTSGTVQGDFTVTVHARDGSQKTCDVATGEEMIFILPYGVGVYPSVKLENQQVARSTRTVWFTFDQIETKPLPSNDGYIFAPKCKETSCTVRK